MQEFRAFTTMDPEEAREVANELYQLLESRGHEVDGVAPVLRETDS